MNMHVVRMKITFPMCPNCVKAYVVIFKIDDILHYAHRLLTLYSN